MEASERSRDLMLNPERWPRTADWGERIYLKRWVERNYQFGMLMYDRGQGRYGFISEGGYERPEEDKVKWGTKELVEEIVREGWLVD